MHCFFGLCTWNKNRQHLQDAGFASFRKKAGAFSSLSDNKPLQIQGL